jgi:hypothetical protein
MAATLSSLKTEVPTRKYGVLRLRYITMGDAVFMHETSQRGLRPREFAALILHHQLEAPALELAEVQTWPTIRLVRVARAWAANPHALDVELPTDEPLVAFQQAVADYWAKQQRHMQEALDQMRGVQEDMWRSVTAGTSDALRHAVAAHLKTDWTALTGSNLAGLAGPNLADVMRSTLGNLSLTSKLEHLGLGLETGLDKMAGTYIPIHLLGLESVKAAMEAAASTSAWAQQVADTETRLRELTVGSIQDALSSAAGLSSMADKVQPWTSMADQMQGWPKIADQIQEWIGDATRTAWDSLIGASHWTSLIQSIEIPSIREDPIPEVRAGGQRIESAGFGFIVDYMPMHLIIRIGAISRRVAHALVTWVLLAMTRSDYFVWRLYHLYTGSPALHGLWPSMAQGIDNHRRGQYYAAICTLLPAVEGTLSDGLRLEGRILVQNNQRIALVQGQIKLNKNGDPVKLSGMHALARQTDFGNQNASAPQTDFHNQEALEAAAAMVADTVAPERNVILHGHKRDYGTAARSVRCLLLLWLLGLWVAELEGADLEPLHPHRLN